MLKKIIKKINNQKNNQEEKGFVILIAVVVSSLLVSIGFFIADISVKEVGLSFAGSESQIAFYVADSSLECALFQDLRVESFKEKSLDTEDIDYPSSFFCNETEFIIDERETSTETSATTFYTANLDLSGRASYTTLEIQKRNSGLETTIVARGFNLETGQNIVERALQVDY